MHRNLLKFTVLLGSLSSYLNLRIEINYCYLCFCENFIYISIVVLRHLLAFAFANATCDFAPAAAFASLALNGYGLRLYPMLVRFAPVEFTL